MPRILYIEDNADNRLLVRRVLMASDYDFEILEAENARKGIEMATTQSPDLILMDISMPDMDGLTATRHLKGLTAMNGVPIVALTANAMEKDEVSARAAGCDGFIRKPVDIDKLPNDIMSYIRSVRS
ncbi:MAG: response regulator [Chloroflexota bacterium]|nr:response regulator [Chloroflexota bacterium]